MRRNSFGEAYCISSTELLDELNEKDQEPTTVYLSNIDPPGDANTWIGEIADNQSGDVVCYIEAATLEGVKAIAAEAGIEDQH